MHVSETAYYLSASRPILVLAAKGVQLPPGHWIRIATPSVTPQFAEELVRDLFPALRDASIVFCTLLTDFDVVEFETAR